MDIILFYSTVNITSKITNAEIIHGGMLKNKFLVQEWSYGGLSDKEGFYDNDHHQDKDWVPKKITNDTDLINIWQPARNKRIPCLAPKCQKPICYILSTFHGNRVSLDCHEWASLDIISDDDRTGHWTLDPDLLQHYSKCEHWDHICSACHVISCAHE